MNVEIGAEAAQFPEKEYINGIAFAVWVKNDPYYRFAWHVEGYTQGVTKRCRLSWLTNSALVYEPKCGGGGSCRISANEYSCGAHGS